MRGARYGGFRKEVIYGIIHNAFCMVAISIFGSLCSQSCEGDPLETRHSDRGFGLLHPKA